MLERADAGIGAILKALGDHGLDADTLVIFTNDNGGTLEGRNTPLSGGKYYLWEGGIRVPCILRWPNVLPAGATSHQAAITMDLTATILAATGTTPARPLDGIDLLPILRGDAPPEERALFWRKGCDLPWLQKAARLGDWKYLFIDGRDKLFDLEGDVAEQHDVSAEHPEIVARLKRALAEWERDVDATPHQFTVRCLKDPPDKLPPTAPTQIGIAGPNARRRSSRE
jgi:arylsulfatase A-like enzyme